MSWQWALLFIINPNNKRWIRRRIYTHTHRRSVSACSVFWQHRWAHPGWVLSAPWRPNKYQACVYLCVCVCLCVTKALTGCQVDLNNRIFLEVPTCSFTVWESVALTFPVVLLGTTDAERCAHTNTHTHIWSHLHKFKLSLILLSAGFKVWSEHAASPQMFFFLFPPSFSEPSPYSDHLPVWTVVLNTTYSYYKWWTLQLDEFF